VGEPLADAIAAAVRDSGQTVPTGAIDKLACYLRLLERWNRAYNLSAVRDAATMVPRHVADSLSIRPWLPEGALLDIGTGGGLPGVVIAIAEPERPVTLLDSGVKKARFLTQALIELDLPNAAVAQARAETWRPDAAFDVVVSRAFGSVRAFWDSARPFLAAGGQALAMKGRYPDSELATLPSDGLSCSVVRLEVAGQQGERHLVRLARPTP